jgi:hypothetical protein
MEVTHMAQYDLEERLAAYRQVARKGTDFLLRQMAPDGSIGPVGSDLYYYRVPWAFALMGELTAASRSLDWIRRRMFTSDGAFEGEATPQGDFGSRYGSYPLACLLVGATLMQRFDLVYPGVRRLLEWQDPETGGLYHRWSERTAEGEQEIFPTAQAGMTFILTGQIEAARKAGQWFRQLRDLQPDWEHRLYAVYSRARGLITEAPAEQEVLYITRKDHPWQHHFNGGISAAFLAKLYMATGDVAWLDLARQYQEFSMTTDACQFESMQTCKSGWGAGLLYVATRDGRYRDWTVRMGDWFERLQHDDGRWDNTKYWTPDPSPADGIHVTAEFVMHVAHIIANLSV